MTIPCPDCGRLNRPGARYCASCQAPLSLTSAQLQPGQLLANGAYRVVRALGKGGMGAVWLVAQTRAFDRLAVLKEVIDYFDPTDTVERQKALDRFEAEARTLGDLKHPGVPDLYAYFSERGHNYLVMEYIEGPDLRQGLTREDADTGRILPGGPLPADAVLRYTAQVAEVLEYLATQQPPVIHNDIKPGNIIIDQHSSRAVLVDFGTARTRYLAAQSPAGGSSPAQAEIYGTVGYAAPELFQGHSESRSDVYSLAATAYHLLTDDDPRDHPMQFPQLDTLPPALADLLRGALSHEVEDRPTPGEFRQQIEAHLAGATGLLRALTFPDGEAADERDELLRLAVKHWDYAAGILHDGTMANWLRRTLHDPVAAQAAEAAVTHWPNSPDAALDEFVRQLAPELVPVGEMSLRDLIIDLGTVGPNQHIVREIQIANRGNGFLRGKIESWEPWAKLQSDSFVCSPRMVCTVPIEIDTTGLAPGSSYLAPVTLRPVTGMPEVVSVKMTVSQAPALPVRITLTAPVVEVSPNKIDFGGVSNRVHSAGPKEVQVTNRGQAAAQVRIQGAPRWLVVEPAQFALVAGARQVVKLTARIDKVRGRKQQVKLLFVVDGGHDSEVEVELQIQRQGLFW
ncbi:MAG: protein kinase [Anaerolineae bacterium]|nr:protein kinase [Anaerolineae bacterium]